MTMTHEFHVSTILTWQKASRGACGCSGFALALRLLSYSLVASKENFTEMGG
jgi:hypothetical protein